MKNNYTKKGVTLIELLIAMVILSSVILAYIGIFGNITKSLTFSKARMLASSLAQEKISILKGTLYYRILITKTPAYLTDFSPPVPYDTDYYPPEEILEGGQNFKRYTYVQVVQEVNGNLQTFPPTTPEIGMKLITVTVVWQQQADSKKVEMRTIATNPDTKMYDASIIGNVRNAQTFTNIPNATALIAENATWSDMTDNSGNYSIALLNGNYTLEVSAWGYFSASRAISIGPNQTITQNFDLSPMSSGTVYGEAWLNDHLVISQVVASTETPSYNQEYVELFNPTTYTWQMAVDEYDPVIGLKYQGPSPAPLEDIHLIYYTKYIPLSSYYLIANTTTITSCGVTKTADAVFMVSTNVIKCREDDSEAAGGVGIYRVSDGSWIDVVGWDWNLGAKSAPIFETDGINQNQGFEKGEQYTRRSRPTGVITGAGRCYDSNNNNIDFVDTRPLIYPPKNSTDSESIGAGVPAIGAMVTANDGLSTIAIAKITGSPPVSWFNLVTVATGTWTVIISSNSNGLEISSVTVRPNISTGVPNGSTNPPWQVSGYNASILSNELTEGYISGKVTNVFGNVISPPITVDAGYLSVQVNSAGYYFVKIATGIYNVTANPGNLDPRYVSSTIDSVEVKIGSVTSGINFILPQGGKVSGFVTRDGINPIPDIVMTAELANGYIKGESISETNGKFQIINLSTGIYYIKPVLSSKEMSTPAVSTVTVTVGSSVFADTFTISGCLGTISGTVTASGKPIKTGVLIIASTSTIPGTPPVLNLSMLAATPHYASNSYETGTYILEVIGSSTTKYNVYAYYVIMSDTGPAIYPASQSNITVLPGQDTPGVNFSW